MKFHHIGIATENIEETIDRIKKFFEIKNISDKVYDPNQDGYLCMITLLDGTCIELISGSVVEKIVKKRQYLYHICYSVSNIDSTIEELVNDGAVVISSPKEAILFDNKRVAFLMWRLGMIELVERGNE